MTSVKPILVFQSRRWKSPERPPGYWPTLPFGHAVPALATAGGQNFAGVGDGDYGFAPNAAPPDTNGAVGATQYVQWVNESFAVFDKVTGAKLYGPAQTQ